MEASNWKVLRAVFCLVVLVSFGKIAAQNPKWLKAIAREKNDTTKVKMLLKVGQSYEESNIDSAYFFYQKAWKLSKKSRWIVGEIETISNLTNLYNMQGKFSESLQLNLKSVSLAKKMKEPLEVAKCYANVGTTYIYENEYEKALKYSLAALSIFENQKNLDLIARMYANLATIYPRIEQYDKALFYINKAITLHESGFATDNYIAALNTKANILCFKGNYKLALPLYEKGLQVAKEQSNLYHMAVFTGNILDTYKLLGRYSEMIPMAKQHLSYCQQFGSNEMLASGYKCLAEAFFNNKQFKKAKTVSDKALQYAKSDSLVEETKYVYELKSKIEFALGNIKEGSDFYNKGVALDDQLSSDQVVRNTQELEAKYETKKKELSIARLTHETQLQEYRSKQRLWIIFSLLIGILCIGIFSYHQYKSYLNKKKLAQQEKQLAIAEERIRIASDMHDDVGAGLSRIRYISAVLKNDQSINNAEFDKIIGLSDEAVEKMNEIIWALNQGNQKIDELVYYIRSQCSEMVHNANIDFNCEPPSEIPDITFGWKENRNTYLLVKEAVNNAIKHAQASVITIDFKIENQLIITVSDNGKGFREDAIRSGANGLKNYQKRIETLQGSYTLDNTDHGVTLQFVIPLHNRLL
jgi:signal transduction histidine kinase